VIHDRAPATPGGVLPALAGLVAKACRRSAGDGAQVGYRARPRSVGTGHERALVTGSVPAS